MAPTPACHAPLQEPSSEDGMTAQWMLYAGRGVVGADAAVDRRHHYVSSQK